MITSPRLIGFGFLNPSKASETLVSVAQTELDKILSRNVLRLFSSFQIICKV